MHCDYSSMMGQILPVCVLHGVYPGPCLAMVLLWHNRTSRPEATQGTTVGPWHSDSASLPAILGCRVNKKQCSGWFRLVWVMLGHLVSLKAPFPRDNHLCTFFCTVEIGALQINSFSSTSHSCSLRLLGGGGGGGGLHWGPCKLVYH